MSVALLDGGSTTTSGGTSQTFDRTPADVNNGNEYSDVSESDFFARQKVLLTAREPSEQTDGTWTKAKRKAQFVMPITLADGSIAYNVVRLEVEYHPEATAANLTELREFGAQMAIQSGLDDFYTAGTLPA